MYYKWVQRCNKHLFSFNSGNSLAIRYLPNEFVSPEIGKLFVFDDKQLALNFQEKYDGSHFELWTCEVTNPTKTKYIHTPYDNEEGFRSYWDWKWWKIFNGHNWWKAPEGTILVDSVKLLDRLI